MGMNNLNAGVEGVSMRVFYLRIILLALLFVQTGAQANIKYDTNPVISSDNRYVSFERHYAGYDFTEIVVVDVDSKSSKTIAGKLFDLVWKDQTLFGAAGLANVSIMRPNGLVVHSAWRTGAGYRAVPREWQDVGTLTWVDGGIAFTAVDINGSSHAWFMDGLNGMLSALQDVNPAPLLSRNNAELNFEKLEITSVGSLLHRRAGADKIIRLGSATSSAFSPGGDNLAVVDDKGQPPVRSNRESRSKQNWPDIYVLSRDGNGLRPLTHSGGTQPTFHPGGKGLAYVTLSGDIGWVSYDGADQSILINNPASVNLLRWHSDGKWLLVQVVDNGMVSWQMLKPPSRRPSSFTKPIAVPGPGTVYLSPSGRKVVVLRQGADSGEVDFAVRNKTRTIQFEYPSINANLYPPSAGWSLDEKYVAISMGGGISILDTDDGSVETITGRLF